MIDQALVKRKLHLNQQELKWLEAFAPLTIDAVAKDPGKYAACERFLERLISRAIAINQHILADRGEVTLNVLRYPVGGDAGDPNARARYIVEWALERLATSLAKDIQGARLVVVGGGETTASEEAAHQE